MARFGKRHIRRELIACVKNEVQCYASMETLFEATRKLGAKLLDDRGDPDCYAVAAVITALVGVADDKFKGSNRQKQKALRDAVDLIAAMQVLVEELKEDAGFMKEEALAVVVSRKDVPN
jgi:hypothetical protein